MTSPQPAQHRARLPKLSPNSHRGVEFNVSRNQPLSEGEDVPAILPPLSQPSWTSVWHTPFLREFFSPFPHAPLYFVCDFFLIPCETLSRQKHRPERKAHYPRPSPCASLKFELIGIVYLHLLEQDNLCPLRAPQTGASCCALPSPSLAVQKVLLIRTWIPRVPFKPIPSPRFYYGQGK